MAHPVSQVDGTWHPPFRAEEPGGTDQDRYLDGLRYGYMTVGLSKLDGHIARAGGTVSRETRAPDRSRGSSPGRLLVRGVLDRAQPALQMDDPAEWCCWAGHDH